MMKPEQIREFLKAQIPPAARRPALMFALQSMLADEAKKAGAPGSDALRESAERLRREAEGLGATLMGLGAAQQAAPTLVERLLGMLE